MEKFEYVYNGTIGGEDSVEAENIEEAIELVQKKLKKMMKEKGWDDYHFDFLE